VARFAAQQAARSQVAAKEQAAFEAPAAFEAQVDEESVQLRDMNDPAGFRNSAVATKFAGRQQRVSQLLFYCVS
jgi:hypothetical protein